MCWLDSERFERCQLMWGLRRTDCYGRTMVTEGVFIRVHGCEWAVFISRAVSLFVWRVSRTCVSTKYQVFVPLLVASLLSQEKNVFSNLLLTGIIFINHRHLQSRDWRPQSQRTHARWKRFMAKSFVCRSFAPQLPSFPAIVLIVFHLHSPSNHKITASSPKYCNHHRAIHRAINICQHHHHQR